jgi:hypothetical protein
LSVGERALLRRLPAELLALLAADPDDPALRRLRSSAYEDDRDAEDEYRGLSSPNGSAPTVESGCKCGAAPLQPT